MDWLKVAIAVCSLAVGCLSRDDCKHQQRVVEKNPRNFVVNFPVCNKTNIDGVILDAFMVHDGNNLTTVKKLGGGVNETGNYFWVTFSKDNFTQHSQFAYSIDCAPPDNCWVDGIELDIYTADFQLVIVPQNNGKDIDEENKIKLRCDSSLNDSSNIRVEFTYTNSTSIDDGDSHNQTFRCEKHQSGPVVFNNRWTVYRLASNSDCVITMHVDEHDEGEYTCKAFLSDEVELSNGRSILLDTGLTPNNPTSNREIPIALIVSMFVGGVAVVILVLFAVLGIVYRRRRPRPEPHPPANPEAEPLLPDDNVEHRAIRQNYRSLEEGDRNDLVMYQSDHEEDEGNATQVPADTPIPHQFQGLDDSVPHSTEVAAVFGATPGTQTQTEGTHDDPPTQTDPDDTNPGPPSMDSNQTQGADNGGGSKASGSDGESGSAKSSPSIAPSTDSDRTQGAGNGVASGGSKASGSDGESGSGSGKSSPSIAGTLGDQSKIPSPTNSDTAASRSRGNSSVASTQGKQTPPNSDSGSSGKSTPTNDSGPPSSNDLSSFGEADLYPEGSKQSSEAGSSGQRSSNTSPTN